MTFPINFNAEGYWYQIVFLWKWFCIDCGCKIKQITQQRQVLFMTGSLINWIEVQLTLSIPWMWGGN